MSEQSKTNFTASYMHLTRRERYRSARSWEWTRRNALRFACGREPKMGPPIDLTGFRPFES
jgi:hypothetical protein